MDTISDTQKRLIKEFADLSAQIDTAKSELKTLTSRKKELEEDIKEYMRATERSHIKIPNGTITLCEKKTKVAIKRDELFDTLNQKHGTLVADEVSKLVYERPTVPVECIKMTKRRGQASPRQEDTIEPTEEPSE